MVCSSAKSSKSSGCCLQKDGFMQEEEKCLQVTVICNNSGRNESRIPNPFVFHNLGYIYGALKSAFGFIISPEVFG